MCFVGFFQYTFEHLAQRWALLVAFGVCKRQEVTRQIRKDILHCFWIQWLCQSIAGSLHHQPIWRRRDRHQDRWGNQQLVSGEECKDGAHLRVHQQSHNTQMGSKIPRGPQEIIWRCGLSIFENGVRSELANHQIQIRLQGTRQPDSGRSLSQQPEEADSTGTRRRHSDEE